MLDLNLHHDDDQDQHPYLFSPKLQSSSSSSCLTNPTFLMTPSHHQPLAAGLGGCCDFSMESHDQQEVYKFEAGWDHNHPSALVDQQVQSDKGLKFKIRRREDSNEYETQNNNNPAKWMSSKMRIMRKMISSDRSTTVMVVDPPTPKVEDHNQQKLRQPASPVETDNSSNSSSNNSARVCADCNTTKTPLWRSGPRGPKTLCNACGIRQRKARRAMAAAAAAANGTALPASIPPPMKKGPHKNKRSSPSGAQFKKRCKIVNSVPSSASSRKKICFEDLRISLSKSSAFQQVFPQDEREAAILLMALSYGMVHG